MAPTRVVLVVLALALAATVLSAAPCTPSDGSLCLSASRFQVSVSWTDFQGNTGAGHAVPLTADTGYFWFFTDTNVELIVKVLDATAINGKFWVFFGALSNVEYTLTVRDSVTGSTKTYQNPSGQFASVGDTAAFAGSAVGQPSHESVAVTGSPTPPSSIADVQRFIDASLATASPKAATDFVPCADAGPSLLLANCRFRVDVHWTDSSGNSGSGQPVQLTADTGYFWFFSDTNVELVVKVLDARPIDGKFWVFFGALSNVQYTVHVTDMVSGALRTYQNPANTFASVGDTSAFRGGFGVSVATDDARTAAGTISAAGGGSLSVSAADGTVFTLTVPANAIASDQDISMTPVSSVSGFPFAGGLAAGVVLQPSGLLLLTGATLSIHTPSPIPSAQETPVAWNGSGEDFFLFPPTPAAGDLSLLITHFAGYGVARATDAERTTQLSREPLEEGDRLEHQISPILRVGRAAAVPAGTVSAGAETTDWRSDLKGEIDTEYGLLKQEMTDFVNSSFGGDADVCISLIDSVVTWKNIVESDLGALDGVFPGRGEEILSLFTQMVTKALDIISAKCINDPNAIDDLPGLFWIADSQGLVSAVNGSLNQAIRCLSFTLDFTSTISSTQPTGGGVFEVEESVKGSVLLKTPTFPSLTTGTGTIQGVSGTVRFAPEGCSYSYTTATATFSALIDWENLFSGAKSVKLKALYYNVSPLDSVITVNCPDTGSTETPSWWFGLYSIAHYLPRPILDYQYQRDGFRLTGSRSPWAVVQQTMAPSPGNGNINESTDFKLSHTPQ